MTSVKIPRTVPKGMMKTLSSPATTMQNTRLRRCFNLRAQRERAMAIACPTRKIAPAKRNMPTEESLKASWPKSACILDKTCTTTTTCTRGRSVITATMTARIWWKMASTLSVSISLFSITWIIISRTKIRDYEKKLTTKSAKTVRHIICSLQFFALFVFFVVKKHLRAFVSSCETLI